MTRGKQPEPRGAPNKRAADSNLRFIETVLNKALSDKPEIRDRIIGEARERIAGALAEGKVFEPVRLRRGSRLTIDNGGARESAPNSDSRFVNAVLSKVVDDSRPFPAAEYRRIDKSR